MKGQKLLACPIKHVVPLEIHTSTYLETLFLKLKTINTKTRMLQAPTYNGLGP